MVVFMSYKKSKGGRKRPQAPRSVRGKGNGRRKGSRLFYLGGRVM